MTPNQYLWSQSRDRLVAAVTGLGYSTELAELMARELGSPKAIDRMTSYIYQARPRTEEMLVDEMLAIKGGNRCMAGKEGSGRSAGEL